MVKFGTSKKPRLNVGLGAQKVKKKPTKGKKPTKPKTRTSTKIKVGRGEKWCFKCRKPKKLKEFSDNRSKKDGKATMCKKCFSGYQTAYRERNRKTAKKRKKAA